MSSPIGQEHIQRFENEGALFPIPVLSEAEVARYRAEWEALSACYGNKLKRFDHSQYFFSWAHELATHPVMLDVVEMMLGPELFVHSTRIFCKPPGDPAFVSWHQDGRYTDLDVKPAPSIWIALSPSTPESGCVRVLQGSHRMGKLPHVETDNADNLLNHGENIVYDIDKERIRHMSLQPGEMSLHHVNMLHSSEQNRSGDARIGFSITFVTPETPATRLPVIHARGNSTDHGFELMKEPPTYDLKSGVAAYAEFIQLPWLQPPKVG